MNIVKTFLRNSGLFRKFSAFLYSLPVILSNLWVVVRGNVVISGCFLRRCSFKLIGKNIRIIIGNDSVLTDCSFYCKGNNVTVKIEGNKTRIKKASFHCEDDDSFIMISHGFSMEGGHIAATEGVGIKIGEDCMFSNDIEIRNGDSHSIWLLASDERLNKAKSVIIGSHVWLCAHSRVMKGSEIPDNSIIGNSAIVSGVLKETNAIYAGSPIQLVKRNIEWSRKRFER